MKMACPRDTPWRITLSTTHLGLALPMLAWALWWWWFRPSLRLIWEAEFPPEAPSYHLYTRKSPQLNMVMMMMIVVTMIANNLKQHSFISTVVQLNFELNERFSRKEKTKEKNYYFWVGGCPPQTILTSKRSLGAPRESRNVFAERSFRAARESRNIFAERSFGQPVSHVTFLLNGHSGQPVSYVTFLLKGHSGSPWVT